MPRGRPKSRQSKILYFEIMLTDGTSYRMVLDNTMIGGYRVYEIENQSWQGIPIIRGPISINDFIHLLEQEKASRA